MTNMHISFTIVSLSGEVCGIKALHSNFTLTVNFVQFSGCSELQVKKKGHVV